MDELVLSQSLSEELLPFSLCFAGDGKVRWVSRRLRAVWLIDEGVDGDKVGDLLHIARPFAGSLDTALLPELTELIIHLHVEGHPDRIVRGQLYPHEGGWLFTGFPMVSNIAQLERLGLPLSCLPIHTALGDMLIANEASSASLKEAQVQASRLADSNEMLGKLNERISKFVPTGFLENVGIETVLDVDLGRHVETRKAIMFADLRKFTALSAQVDVSRIFEVINRYLYCTVPCIEAHGGYVVQYLGDGIMALFPDQSLAAAQAAIEMQRELRVYAATVPELPAPLKLSIGIHEGPVALGIIGSQTRWDASIIADSVNTSARIESMTRVLGGEGIVSERFLDSAPGRDDFAVRDLGVHTIRGRTEDLRLFELLDCLDESTRKSRDATQEDFGAGLQAYESGDLYEAMSRFSRVLAKVSDDQAAQFYLARINHRLRETGAGHFSRQR